MTTPPAPHTSGLPAELTAFVGRRTELAAVKRTLSAHRLVTLIGPGGVGKTRLALRTTDEVRRRFADGVRLVEFAEVSSAGHVAEAVGAALDLRDQSASDPVDGIVEYLCRRRVLLVLDNCEHLSEEIAALVRRILRWAPEVRVLATSRQALGVSGEHLVVVPPLSAPSGGTAVFGDVPLAELLRYEAVQLFVDRAAAVAPGFTIDESERAAVRTLCARLEGIPLAIELAAARLRSMTLDQVAARVDDLVGLLTGSNAGAEPRQRALTALMDWSFELCTPAERAAWARASVFEGSFDLDGATAVCGADALDALAGLVDKSVLTLVPGPPARYRFLEPIRQFGRARLAAFGDEAEVRGLHGAYVRELVLRADEDCFTAAQLVGLARIQQFNPDVRAVLDRSLAGDGVDAADMAGALRVYWHAVGSLSEGARWVDRVLEVRTSEDHRRGVALWTRAWLALMQGDADAAAPLLTEGGRLADRLGAPDLRDEFLLAQGVAALHVGDLDTARERLSRAHHGFRARDERVGTAIALVQLALLAVVADDLEAAAAHAAACVRLSERYGESWYRAHGHWVLGLAWWRSGRTAEAEQELKQSISVMRDFGEQLVMARSFEVLGWIANDRGDPERAARLLGMADRVWSKTKATLSAFGRLTTYHRDRIEALTVQLGAPALEKGMREGAALDLPDAIAAALGERTERPVAAPHRAASTSELTRREEEVAALVADGLSNREIAARLVLSLRTVEAHMERILNKLGFRSRAQVAAWVSARAAAEQGS
ncbi:LuxR C-terminal-related transcriptional regulator [Pseudonocardia sp. NPDC049154]|uniref:ATP-binding protein n=1 Tax=Pseudonocardia sp. NPDC049154 TaxID=3155501 RepID=UPI0033DD8F8D